MNDLTVVICTRNNKGVLIKSLPSIVAKAKEANANVLVVQNDTSKEHMFKHHECRDFGIKQISLKKPGLANARLKALKHVHTKYVAYCDDDIYPLPNAFVNAVSLLERQGGWAIAGGPIYCGVPKVSKAHLSIFACNHYRPDSFVERDLSKLECLPGALLIMSTQVAKTYMPLVELKGRKGRGWLDYSGEDFEFQAIAGANNVRCFYDPSIEAIHRFNPQRANWLNIMKMSFSENLPWHYLLMKAGHSDFMARSMIYRKVRKHLFSPKASLSYRIALLGKLVGLYLGPK